MGPLDPEFVEISHSKRTPQLDVALVYAPMNLHIQFAKLR